MSIESSIKLCVESAHMHRFMSLYHVQIMEIHVHGHLLCQLQIKCVLNSAGSETPWEYIIGSNKYVNRKLNHCGTLIKFIDTCHSIVIYTGLVYNKNNICQKTKQEYAFKS